MANLVGGAFSLFENIAKFIAPNEFFYNPEGFTNRQLKAMTQGNALRDLLNYRYYQEDSLIGAENFHGGIYTMADGRKGVILQIQPPPFFTESIEEIVEALIGQVLYDDIVMHLAVHASKNIKTFIDDYRELHSCQVNVKRPEVLQAMVNERANSMLRWSKESMSGISEFKLRTFTNVISFLFPYELTDNQIREQVSSFIGVLNPLHPKNFDPDQLLTMTKELLNPDLDDYNTHTDIHKKMNVQMSKNAKITAENGKSHFKLGKSTYARTLTTDSFPRRLESLDFQSAFIDPFGSTLESAIPGQFYMALNIIFTNTQKRIKSLRSKMAWNIEQLDGLKPKTFKKNPELRDKLDEAQEVIDMIDEEGQIPLDAMWTLTIFENSLGALDTAQAKVIKRFADINGVWKLAPETSNKIGYQSFLYNLPLQHASVVTKHLARNEVLFRTNNSQIAPLLTDMQGFGRPYLVYNGRGGQIIPIDPLSQEYNYNFMGTGGMGAGKSVFSNDVVSSLLQCGFRAIGMDIGRSYYPSVDAVGGQFVEFTDDANLCFNFFTNILTNKITKFDAHLGKDVTITKIHEDELSTIIPIVGLMMGVELVHLAGDNATALDDQLDKKVLSIYIEEAVNLAFEHANHGAGMEHVYDALHRILDSVKEQQSQDLIELLSKALKALEDFALPTGKFYRYFNGANNIKFELDYYVLELDDLLAKKQQLLPIIQLAMLQRIAIEAFLDDKRPMVIFFDEARDAMKDRIVSSALLAFGTRFRKYKKFLVVLSQSPEDFNYNKASRTLYKTSSYKVLLNPKVDMIKTAVKDNLLELNDFQMKQVTSVKNLSPHYNEVALIFEGQILIVASKLTRLELYLYTTKSAHKDRRDALMRRLEFTFLEAAYYMMIEDENKFHGDQEILEAMQIRMNDTGHEQKNKELWIGRIRKATSEQSFQLYALPLFYNDMENDAFRISSFEVLARIKTTDGDIPAIKFIDIAKEFELYEGALKSIILQAFERFKDNPYRFSINATIDDILNSSMVDFIIRESINYGVNDRLTVEVQSRPIQHSETDNLLQNVHALQANDIYFALDGVNQHNIDLAMMLQIRPDFLKLDGRIIESLEHDEHAKLFVHMITKGLSSVGIKVSAIKVATTDIEKVCYKHGIRYMQGYALAEPKPLQLMFEQAEQNPKLLQSIELDEPMTIGVAS